MTFRRMGYLSCMVINPLQCPPPLPSQQKPRVGRFFLPVVTCIVWGPKWPSSPTIALGPFVGLGGWDPTHPLGSTQVDFFLPTLPWPPTGSPTYPSLPSLLPTYFPPPILPTFPPNTIASSLLKLEEGSILHK
jgi:hypothetical protein